MFLLAEKLILQVLDKLVLIRMRLNRVVEIYVLSVAFGCIHLAWLGKTLLHLAEGDEFDILFLTRLAWS